MTSVAFPAGLPYPIRDNFTYQYANQPSRATMDDGTNRSQRQWTAQPRAFTFTWSLTWEQATTWEAWFKWDTLNGSLFVDIPVNEDETQTVQFIQDNYVIANNGFQWTITATVQSIVAAPEFNTGIANYPSWPDTLPDIEQASYSYKRQGASHSNVPDGYQDSRQRFDSLRADVTITLMLDAAQRDIFDDFVHNDLIAGQRWFMMPLTSPQATQFIRCKWTNSPVITSSNGVFKVTGAVETFDLPVESQLAYQFGTEFNVADTINIAEHVRIIFQGVQYVFETISIGEHFARAAFPQDTISLGEDFQTKYTNHPAESVTFGENIGTDFGPGGVGDNFDFLETLSFSVRNTRLDTFTLVETVKANTSYNRQVPESLTFGEAIFYAGTYFRPQHETTSLAEQGKWKMQDYYLGSTYYAEDYYGSSGTF